MAEIASEVFTATLWFAVSRLMKGMCPVLKQLKSDWDFMFGFLYLGACVPGRGAVQWDMTRMEEKKVKVHDNYLGESAYR